MPTESPLEVVSTVDAATQRLREQLFSGAYTPGEYVKDSVIAESMGISRPTARIAIQQLVAQRLLERRPGQSAKVRSFDTAEVQDIYSVREMIELRAIQIIQDQDLDLGHITQALAAFEQIDTTANWADVAAQHTAFHTAVVETTDSPRLIDFFSTLTAEIHLLLAPLRQHYLSQDSLFEDHSQLLWHLQHSSGDELRNIWTAHLDESRSALEASVFIPTTKELD